MSSFARKLRRKRQNNLFREFKKKMKKLRETIRCALCGKIPQPGIDTIDEWGINDSEGIEIICTDCYKPEKTKDED